MASDLIIYSCAGGLEFKSRTGKTLHSFANIYYVSIVTVLPQGYDVEMGSANSLHASA